MRLLLATLLFSLTCTALAAPPATKPATKPAAAPKQRFSLMNGAVKFMVPAGWAESQKADDGKSAQYSSPDGVSTISIVVIPQEYPVPLKNDNLKEQMKTFVINGLRRPSSRSAIRRFSTAQGPKPMTAFICIHARIKDGDETLDQLHLYRAAGLDLLMFTMVVKTDNKDEAAIAHTAGEDIALSTVLGVADKKPAGK